MPTIQELDDNIFFVQVTTVLPSEVMMPGNVLLVDGKPVSLEKHKEHLKNFPTYRMSLHWFVNDIVMPHEDNAHVRKYVIIERAKFLRPQLYGGCVEDFFSIGPYRLSSEAVIFVPANELEQARKQLRGFKGKIITYTSVDLLETEVKAYIAQASAWKITVPQNQKITRTSSTQKALAVLKKAITLSNHEKAIQKLVEQAAADNKASFEYQDNCLGTELKLLCNDKEYLAADFFKSWYDTGLYADLHQNDKLFGKFEEMVERFRTPLVTIYLNPTLNSLEGLRTPQDAPVLIPPHLTKILIAIIKDLLEQIEIYLKEAKFPQHVLNYFEEEWKINFSQYWLSVFDEDIERFGEEKNLVFCDVARLKEKVAWVGDQIISHPGRYSNKEIEYQSTAAILSQFLKVEFVPKQQEGSTYVDAVCEVSEEQVGKLSESLSSKNIPFIFFNKQQIIVPKINTKNVAETVRELSSTAALGHIS